MHKIRRNPRRLYRDIVCMPRTTKNGELAKVVSYPRKKYRAMLGAMGLIGKLHLTSDMIVNDVQFELCSKMQ